MRSSHARHDRLRYARHLNAWAKVDTDNDVIDMKSHFNKGVEYLAELLAAHLEAKELEAQEAIQ